MRKKQQRNVASCEEYTEKTSELVAEPLSGCGTAGVAKRENGENGGKYEIALWLLERTFDPGPEKKQQAMCSGTDMGCKGGRCPRNKYENTFAVSGKREGVYTRVLDLYLAKVACLLWHAPRHHLFWKLVPMVCWTCVLLGGGEEASWKQGLLSVAITCPRGAFVNVAKRGLANSDLVVVNGLKSTHLVKAPNICGFINFSNVVQNCSYSFNFFHIVIFYNSFVHCLCLSL